MREITLEIPVEYEGKTEGKIYIKALAGVDFGSGDNITKINKPRILSDKEKNEMSEKGDGWIYRNPYNEYEKLFEKIEEALGFKLFVWQKSYIVMGIFRQYGETTARILRDLLSIEEKPLDYTKPAKNHMENFYRRETKKMEEKLKSAGIETRVVFWEEKDKWRYVHDFTKCSSAKELAKIGGYVVAGLKKGIENVEKQENKTEKENEGND